jgi:hypothetical protein
MCFLIEKIAEIAQRFQVADIYVFGSRAKEIAARFRQDGTECGAFFLRGEAIPMWNSGSCRGRGEAYCKRACLPDGGIGRSPGVNRVDLVILRRRIISRAGGDRGELLYSEDLDRQAGMSFLCSACRDLCPSNSNAYA